MTVEKQLLQAVAHVMRLDPLRESGQMDDAGSDLLRTAEEALLSQPPRIVLAAFATWNRTGRLSLDRRQLKVTDTGELSPRNQRGSGSGLSAALYGYRGSKG